MIPRFFPVTCHTDFVGEGSTFVAIPGMRENGVQYIRQALEKGAKRIISEQDIPEDIKKYIQRSSATLEIVNNARRALAEESIRAYNNPAKKLRIFGITGTKGKTSTAFLLAHFLEQAGNKTALISSAGIFLDDIHLKNDLATPQPDFLHAFFHECLKHQVTNVVMETTAQALTCDRVHGVFFDGVIFTNFSMEHGEFYQTQQEYFHAKCQIISHLKKDAYLFYNADNLANKLADIHKHSIMFGMDSGSYRMKRVSSTLHGITATLVSPESDIPIFCPTLMGTYNAYNITGAAACALKTGVQSDIIQAACENFTGIPGRFNLHKGIKLSSGAKVFIDKAHNPSSYQAILSALRPLTHHLIVVFGAGGERDKARRPLMGSLAARYADVVILTSDDPRSENPSSIIEDILKGIEDSYKVICEIDREKAIEKACKIARKESIVLLLGKGSEAYQLTGGKKRYFNESEIVDNFISKQKKDCAVQ